MPTRAQGRWQLGRVDSLKRRGPSVLRQIVVEEAEARAEHRLTAVARGVRDAQARAELLAVVVRHAGVQRNLQRLQREKRGILRLAVAGRGKQTEGRLLAQSVVERQMPRDAPRILRVEAEPLHALREAAVAGRSGRSPAA